MVGVISSFLTFNHLLSISFINIYSAISIIAVKSTVACCESKGEAWSSILLR